MTWANRQRGFTIVELLIVVVVIAILAAITIVAYTGISQRANESAVQNEVSQLVRKVEVFKTTGTSYPDSETTAGISSKAGTLTYATDPLGSSYCIQIQKDATTFSATNTNPKPVKGDCLTFGLLGWWKFNGNANDDSTLGNGGSISGTLTTTNGQSGIANGAVSFSSASYFTASPVSSQLASDAQTFSFWVKPANWSTATASTFIAKRSAGATGFFISYLNANNALGFDCGGSGQRWNTGYAPPLTIWTHVTLTCSMAGTTNLYVNGVLQPGTSTVSRSAIATGTVLRIGQDSSGTTLPMNGDMDDVRIYNRVLTPSEIAALYAANAQ